MEPHRSQYVNRWHMTGSMQPFIAEDVRMYGFVFPAKYENLLALTDRYLIEPTNGYVDYAPVRAISWIAVTFAHIGKLYSPDPEYRTVGWMEETEVTFWVFTPSGYFAGIPTRARFFTPYLFVDVALAITYGRAIYGFPKERGWFEYAKEEKSFPRGDCGPQTLSVKAFGVEHFTNDPKWEPYELIRLEHTGHSQPEQLVPKPSWVNFAEITDDLIGGLADWDGYLWGIPGQIGNAAKAWPPIGKTVFLKQFYHSNDSGDACHQAVVEAGIGIRGVPVGGLLNHEDYRMIVTESDTHPIIQDLGLMPNADGAVSPCLAYWVDFAFEVYPGREVWRADEGPLPQNRGHC